MADAESNLVPSEAADQVEVALEEQAAADDGILYLNSISTKTTSSPTLRAWSPRPGVAARCMSRGNCRAHRHRHAGGRRQLDEFGVVLIVFGAFLAWWSKNLHHTLARDFIEAVEADESMGGRYRRVAANEDGLMVWGKSGKSQFFPFEKLDHVLDGERIFVAMFADQGVTIPKDTFVAATPSSLAPSLSAHQQKTPHRDQEEENEGRKGRCQPNRATSPRRPKASNASRRKTEEALRPSQTGHLAPLPSPCARAC
ncbi:MAG: hypothetical protein ACLTYW_00400 [Collinsella sp.]